MCLFHSRLYNVRLFGGTWTPNACSQWCQYVCRLLCSLPMSPFTLTFVCNLDSSSSHRSRTYTFKSPCVCVCVVTDKNKRSAASHTLHVIQNLLPTAVRAQCMCVCPVVLLLFRLSITQSKKKTKRNFCLNLRSLRSIVDFSTEFICFRRRACSP